VKLLLDENLAPRLVSVLADIYPQSAHVGDLDLKSSPDSAVWSFAAKGGLAIVSKDSDFRQRSFLYGAPPKIVWIRLGNCSTTRIEQLLRARRAEVEAFCESAEAAFLSLG
jgi:predicted nuclease of predicted toxin-antitoxin system